MAFYEQQRCFNHCPKYIITKIDAFTILKYCLF